MTLPNLNQLNERIEWIPRVPPEWTKRKRTAGHTRVNCSCDDDDNVTYQIDPIGERTTPDGFVVHFEDRRALPCTIGSVRGRQTLARMNFGGFASLADAKAFAEAHFAKFREA